MRKAANKIQRNNDPVNDVRIVGLYNPAGFVVMCWNMDYYGMPIEEVRTLCAWAKSLGIPVEYDYGTCDPDLMLDPGIEGVG